MRIPDPSLPSREVRKVPKTDDFSASARVGPMTSLSLRLATLPSGCQSSQPKKKSMWLARFRGAPWAVGPTRPGRTRDLKRALWDELPEALRQRSSHEAPRHDGGTPLSSGHAPAVAVIVDVTVYWAINTRPNRSFIRRHDQVGRQTFAYTGTISATVKSLSAKALSLGTEGKG